ncbi:MAG: hypothetical protein JRH20_05855 [Deltaproteobacteria bacterium]|nr:hypothetical protein [Deltaproteobacteria bacterium]
MVRRAAQLSLGLVVALSLLLHTPEAEAKGFAIINTGEDIFEAGPVPAPFDKNPKFKPMRAGYKCKIFGIFWAYLHTWKCEPVAFVGNSFVRHAKLSEVINAKYHGKHKGGLWKIHGRWLFLLVLIGFIAMGFMGRKKKGEGEAEE